uniref:Uncharacterized protein n=1 Tax=Lepeophtheirus salmonis TaxID=72036 RepID=A0A0K2TLG3_LEPSM
MEVSNHLANGNTSVNFVLPLSKTVWRRRGDNVLLTTTSRIISS